MTNAQITALVLATAVTLGIGPVRVIFPVDPQLHELVIGHNALRYLHLDRDIFYGPGAAELVRREMRKAFK